MTPKPESHPFFGIANKLERADENILNLHREILTFFKESKYPVIPNPNDKKWQDAVNYHRNLLVPKRFGVLAGEIVHHLRSSFDHVIWHFSSATARRDDPNGIDFPVFRGRPTKKELPRYNRKVQGISNAKVLALIEELQPYQRGSDAANHPLCIIHDMDRFDKHRELAIVSACANLTFPAGTRVDIIANVIAHRQGKKLSVADFAEAQRAVKNEAKVTPQVAFTQFGKWDTQFVVPALKHLLNFTINAVGLFAGEL